jgi:F-type H+-transporting ATPase subunit a
MVKENLYVKKQQYFTAIFFLFMVLLLANMVGMIPYSFTITSSFIVTFFLSLTFFVGLNVVAAVSHQ